MSFEARITTAPVPFDAARGRDILAGLPQVSGATAELLLGTAACSPFLGSVMKREADWLPALLGAAPEATRDALLEAVRTAPGAQHKSAFRQAKRRIALLTALCDLGGVWPLETVTAALTDFADTCLQAGLSEMVRAEAARGRLPGQGAEDAATGAGMVVLAMGKMGAHELNYSSDIDLICLFDQERYGPRAYQEARASFIKITRRLMALMSDLTADGYVFRTDLRLRPNPSVTPVCIAMEAAERYYESIGRGWERAAHIKARPCAGDLEAGAAYLERLRPFIWRKHLDFVAVRESEEMRVRIRAHKGLTGPLGVEGHDIKLGAGGIREIEFFTQTHQMISGGRDPSVRNIDTVGALASLAAGGWVPRETSAALTGLYRRHRRVEHALQMVADAQTQKLPKGADELRRIGCLLGEGDLARFRATVAADLAETARLTEPFFTPPAAVPPPPVPELPEESQRLMARWPDYPALRSDRAVAIFERLKPELLAKLDRAAHPHEALVQFDRFLAGLPAGVQLFTMFEARPQLIDLIVDICGTAPALAHYLSRNASVFDAVIAGQFFTPWPGQAALEAELARTLARIDDYERQLDATRRWQKEWHFRVGVHHLRGIIDADAAAAQYSDIADAVLRGLWPHVEAEFARKHGPAPGRGVAVLGMGSLGAQRLTATSDLDLITIYDAQGEAESQGPRPLAVAQYYARLTKALVTALSAPMAEGVAYEVDMRLRPSGRQGPVATALSSFAQYQRNEAWTWEHLALTRARVLVGAADLAAEIEAVRAEVLRGPPDRAKVLADTADMRRRLFAEKPARSPWDAKQGPGGLTDLELFGQAASLLSGASVRAPAAQIGAAVAAGLVTADLADGLIAQYQALSRLNIASRLLSAGLFDPDEIGEGGRALLAREMSAPGIAAVAERLEADRTRAAEVITAALETETAAP